MEIVWLDENIATVPDQPNVQLEFAETADDGIIDTVLGLLLRAAPNKSATERNCRKKEAAGLSLASDS